MGEDRGQCEGSRVAWRSGHRGNPHPAGHFYRPCWRCSESMGCSNCAGPPTEVLCTRCAVWTTKAAFLHHGPILNTPAMIAKRGGTIAPQTDEYPAAWAAEYRRMPKPEMAYAGRSWQPIKPVDDANEDA